jgi:hypothetical protein
MDQRLRQKTLTEATRAGLQVSETLFTRLDAYIARFYRLSPSRDQLVIQTYLAQAAIRIAKSEGKSVVEAEDAKAAIWMFHLPQNPDDPCGVAGEQALLAERTRGRYSAGMLTESFRDFLNSNS